MILHVFLKIFLLKNRGPMPQPKKSADTPQASLPSQACADGLCYLLNPVRNSFLPISNLFKGNTWPASPLISLPSDHTLDYSPMDCHSHYPCLLTHYTMGPYMTDNAAKDLHSTDPDSMSRGLIDQCLLTRHATGPCLTTRYSKKPNLITCKAMVPYSMSSSSTNLLPSDHGPKIPQSSTPACLSSQNTHLAPNEHPQQSHLKEISMIVSKTVISIETLTEASNSAKNNNLQGGKIKRAKQKPTRRSVRIQKKMQTGSAKPQFSAKAKTKLATLPFDIDSNQAPLNTNMALTILQASGLQINKRVEEMIDEAVRGTM